MEIAIGGDHAGFLYKKEIIIFLESLNYSMVDFGPFAESSCDYPDFAHPLAQSIQDKKFPFGILICGSGNGVAMTANKHPDVRAALCWTVELAILSRAHNDANIVCIPARFISLEIAKSICLNFLKEPFEGGRHLNRVQKINVNIL